jgi:PfpI family intracellular protease
MERLQGLKVAILVTDGFEEVEMVEPRNVLDDSGACTRLVAPKERRVRSWGFKEWSGKYPVDIRLDQARSKDFQALLLPGGVMNSDSLRMMPKAVAFTKSFFDAGKPVAVISHGAWTIIETGAVRGRKITSWPSLKTDLRNAGAEWLNQEVVVDGNLVSSRIPDDIPAFNVETNDVFARFLAQLRLVARDIEMAHRTAPKAQSLSNEGSEFVARMGRHQFGSTHREVPVIGQGTWGMDKENRAAAINTLDRGIYLGMRHIDTAEMYGSGIVEEIVGAAIEGRRDKVFLVSKVLPRNASRRGTIVACERSLVRLNTDYLDSYLLHWRGQYPLEETFSAFEELMQSGKILSWGVSNFDVPDLEEASKLAGEGGLVCNQAPYHLQQRAIEHAVLPWCEKHNVAVVAYSPLGHGRFPASEEPGGRVLQEIAEAHHSTPRQVALSFIVRRPSQFAIPKASRPEHAAENAGAGDLHLTAIEGARIDRAFPRSARTRTLPAL